MHQTRFQNRTSEPVLLFAILVCLMAATGSKPWIHEAARDHRRDYPARLASAHERPDSAGVVTFYAMGDWGGGKGQSVVAGLLRADLRDVGAREVRPFVLGAGDNYYPDGLPEGWPRDHVTGLFLDRGFGEVYAECVYDSRPVTFHSVHGNHDHRGDVYVWETFAERRFNGSGAHPRFVSYPLRGPGIADTNNESEYDALVSATEAGEILTLPELVPLPTDKLAIVAIDSEVMIRLYEDARHKRADDPASPAATIERHWEELERLMERHAHVPWIFVLGHHPLAGHGPHGGHHTRPLGLRLEALWAGMRSLVGQRDIQDLSHPAYAEFATRLGRVLSGRERIAYVSGHEHSLQLLWYRDRLLQVISGAGSKLSPVGRGPDTAFKVEELGLVRFDVAGDDLWIEYIYGPELKKRQSTAFRVAR